MKNHPHINGVRWNIFKNVYSFSKIFILFYFFWGGDCSFKINIEAFVSAGMLACWRLAQRAAVPQDRLSKPLVC